MTSDPHTHRRNRVPLKSALAAALVLMLMLLVGFVAIGRLIGSGVDEATALASADYSGDRVDALIAYVDSPAHPLRLRNRAAWALGQIGDPRAVPTLEKYYTGQPCDHARFLCQHELDKALRQCRGSRNISAFLWR